MLNTISCRMMLASYLVGRRLDSEYLALQRVLLLEPVPVLLLGWVLGPETDTGVFLQSRQSISAVEPYMYLPRQCSS
jgi:hypothetical protein